MTFFTVFNGAVVNILSRRIHKNLLLVYALGSLLMAVVVFGLQAWAEQGFLPGYWIVLALLVFPLVQGGLLLWVYLRSAQPRGSQNQ